MLGYGGLTLSFTDVEISTHKKNIYTDLEVILQIYLFGKIKNSAYKNCLRQLSVSTEEVN